MGFALGIVIAAWVLVPFNSRQWAARYHWVAFGLMVAGAAMILLFSAFSWSWIGFIIFSWGLAHCFCNCLPMPGSTTGEQVAC